MRSRKGECKMKIILAVDESRYSTWAVDLLLKLPLAEPPKVHVLHVVDVKALKHPFLLTSALTNQYKRIMQEEAKKRLAAGHQLLDAVADRLRARWTNVRPTVHKGDTAETIVATAKKEKADLVILGSHGRGKIDAFLLGSVSQKVTTYAPCSVLIAKRKSRVLRKVLLAVDGSEYSDAAEKFLRTQIIPNGIHITVLHVWDHPMPLPDLPVRLAIENRQSRTLTKAGFKSRALILQGHTAGTIVDTINRKHVDLVVLGSRGETGLKRFFLGGVSHKVMKYSHCSVLIVKKKP